MKDPVRGTGEVISTWPPAEGAGRGRLRLILTAEGIEPTPVDYKSNRHWNRWPFWTGTHIPVTVDRAKPTRFRIEWGEMPKKTDVRRSEEQARENERLAQLRGERD